ncbi:MAG: Ig-like domain repeat protein, partial [Thaumarchaeota archaeon]|nr:Ig-like domain repeat protein [Nitrososphaerota archaeon]
KTSVGVFRPVTSGISATPTASVIAASIVNSIAGTSVDKTTRASCNSNAAGDAICDEWKVSPGLQIPYTNPTTGNTAYYQYYCQGDGFTVTDSTQPLGSMANPDPVCPNVNKKDLFVEVNYMAGFQPNPTALNDVVNAFANHGIQLHIQINPSEAGFHNQTIPLNGYTTPTGTYIKGFFDYKQDFIGIAAEHSATPPAGFSGSQSEYVSDILSAKRQAFHYAMFIDQLRDTPTSSGWSDIGGNNFVVSLGAFTNDVGSVVEQESTFMHELGHNLGLNHGGAIFDSLNCKPNYPSVMNYLFQFPTLIPGRSLDYSESQIASLNENNLNEQTGIGQSTPSGLQTVIGGVDSSGNYLLPLGATFGNQVAFSRDATLTNGVQTNIHEFNIPNCDASTNSQLTTLNGWNDWANLNFNFRSSSLFSNGFYTPVSLNKDLTSTALTQIEALVITKLNSGLNSLPDSNFASPSTSRVIFNNDISIVISDIQSKNVNAAISELQAILELVNGPTPLITDKIAQNEMTTTINGIISSLQANLPPMASSQTVYVNGITTTPVTLQATDPNNLPLAYSSTNPSHGTLTGTAPNLMFNAFSSFTNTDSFTFHATNTNNVQSNTATILLKLENFPIANSQSVTLTENGKVALVLTGSGGSAPLQFSIVQGTSSGDLSGTAPNLVYTPATGFTGQDSFTFQTSDGLVNSSPATVSISIVAPSKTTVSTNTIVSVVPSSVIVGGSTTVTAQVVGSSPSGTVSFSAASGSFQPNQCTLSNAGTCSVTFTSSAPGQVQISGSYSGDLNNLPSSSSTLLKVSKATPSIAPSLGPSNVAVGATTTVTVQINNGFLPGGTVSFASDGAGSFNSTSCTVNNNQCAVTYTPSSVGTSTHTITATYSGDANNQGSSNSVGLTVTPTAPTESVTLTPSSVIVGSSSVVLVKINGISPTGTVSFTSNSTGSFNSTSCTVHNNQCAVTYAPSSVSNGYHKITAAYSGDPNNKQNTNNAVLSVSQAIPTTTISLGSSSIPLGGSTTVAAQITNGFSPSGTVSFSAASGSFQPNQCTLSNAGTCSVTFTSSSSGQVSIMGIYSGDTNNKQSSGSVILTVGSLESQKSGLASTIKGLESGIFDKGMIQKLARAADHIQNSATNSLWNTDGTTLDLKNGNKVFNQEADAVNILKKLLLQSTSQDTDLVDPRGDDTTKDHDLDSVITTTLPLGTASSIQTIINQLVSIDNTLAQNQVNTATSFLASLQSHNAPPALIAQVQKDVSNANSWMQKAQSDLAGGNSHRAIYDYRQAWESATDAMNLSGANLQGYNLSGMNLQGVTLSGVNLQGANLQNTNLQGDDLSGSNLQNAILSGANLQGANLKGDNLQNANLTGANLTGANLKGANTSGAIGLH